MSSQNSSKPLLLGQRATSKTKVQKLAPINTEAIKNKDLIVVNVGERNETMGGTFNESMLQEDVDQAAISKEMKNRAFNSQTNFVKKNLGSRVSLTKLSSQGSDGGTKPVRTVRNLPAIDHGKTRDKLVQIIGNCDDLTSKNPSMIEQRNQRGSSMGNPSRVKEAGKEPMRRVASQVGVKENQPDAPATEMEPIAERLPKARNTLIDRQKKLIAERPEKIVIQDKKVPTKRERPLKFENKPATEAEPKPKRSIPTKWLMTLIQQNYQSFAQRLDALEIKKRVRALTNMKREWRRRVNLFQAHYRLKKYGEEMVEYEEVNDIWGEDTKEKKLVQARLKKLEEGALQALNAVNKLLKGREEQDAISDLHTVNEEDDEEFETKKEVGDFVFSDIMGDLLYKEVRHMAWSVLKVKTWLLMCVHRTRFLKKKECVRKIQGMIRVSQARKIAKHKKIQKEDVVRVQKLEKFINVSKNLGKMQAAAKLIQNEIFRKRIRRSKLARELRDKLKALPYVCRAGFVKMNSLKADTMALNKNVTRLFSAKGGRPK